MEERRIEKFVSDEGKWVAIPFEKLHKDDVFRIFDNGERYVNKEDGNNVWIATGEPYLNKDGVYAIDTLY